MYPQTEQRKHERVPFLSHVNVKINGLELEMLCLDLSSHGALLSRPEGLPVHLEQAIDIHFYDEQENRIDMHGVVAHVNDDVMGCACDCLDISSMAALEDLLKKHLGNEASARRLASLMG